MVYYFNEYLLPYDFILPYENHKELLFEYDAHRYKKAQRKEINICSEKEFEEMELKEAQEKEAREREAQEEQIIIQQD
jgi:hypothetical protein